MKKALLAILIASLSAGTIFAAAQSEAPAAAWEINQAG